MNGNLKSGLLRGQCLCRDVTYEVDDAFKYSYICHCADCRRATGSAFKPFAGIEVSKLRIVSGDADLHRYGEGENYDAHCKRCGSLLYSIVQSQTMAHITLGTLIDEPSVRPSCHIFVGSKANWYEISDQLPRHEKFPIE